MTYLFTTLLIPNILYQPKQGPTGENLETELANLVAKIREGMSLRRASQIIVDQARTDSDKEERQGVLYGGGRAVGCGIEGMRLLTLSLHTLASID